VDGFPDAGGGQHFGMTSRHVSVPSPLRGEG
jgi:hypothetical protein